MPPWKYSWWHLVITSMETARWPCFNVLCNYVLCMMYYESKIWEVERWVINHSKYVMHSEIWIHISARKITNHKNTWSEYNIYSISTFWNLSIHFLWPIYGLFYKKVPYALEKQMWFMQLSGEVSIISLRPSWLILTLLYCYWLFTALPIKYWKKFVRIFNYGCGFIYCF